MSEACRILSATGWLSTRPKETQAQILSIGRLRRFKAGQPLYRVGDLPNGLFGVVTGSARVFFDSDDGGQVNAHRVEPGFWVGDLAIFADQKRLITLVAVSDMTVVWMPQPDLLELVQRDPSLFRDFYDLTYRNMELAIRLCANLAITDSERRIVQRFLLQDGQTPETGRWIPISQDELAELAAVSLPTLQRNLRRVTKAGLIEVGYGKFRVLDREGLVKWLVEPGR